MRSAQTGIKNKIFMSEVSVMAPQCISEREGNATKPEISGKWKRCQEVELFVFHWPFFERM